MPWVLAVIFWAGLIASLWMIGRRSASRSMQHETAELAPIEVTER